MKNINKKAKALAEWEEILMPIEIEALHDTYHTNPEEILTPNEVLDIIVKWNGGLADGYDVRNIVKQVYGIEL